MSNLFRPLIVALSLLLALAFSSNAGSGMCDFSGREKLVNDFAGVFTYAQREMLECELVAFDDSTSNQICVVTVTDLEGKDVGQYALRLGNDWGIGSGKNNGVLVLLKSRTDDDPYIDVAIQVGRGLEGAIPDAYASRIIRNIMGPQLKQDRYFEAVQAACEELKALACNEISEPRDDEEDVPLGLISAFVIIGLIIIIVALYVDAKHPHDKGSSGNVGGGRRPPIIFFGGGRSSSGPSFGGMGGGGFRGFGGGSFGGGGATGRFGFIPLFLASAMLSNISCSAQVLPGDVAHERYFDGTYYHDIPNPGWETEVKARADMMLMQWTPLLDVPGSFLKPDLYFAAGETVTGIPYSSVSSYNCYMGRDVSFYTFLSSLKNPKSLMYTTDYRQPGDYSRKSCYYGSTCCNTVIYNWGIQTRATCYSVATLSHPLICRRETTSLSDVRLFDMVLYVNIDEETKSTDGGHAMMVYDIARDKDGVIKKLTIFESAHPTSRITEYTLADFQDRLDEQEQKGKGKSYFYYYDHENNKGIYALPAFMENNPGQLVYDFPTALCTDRGDRVTYGTGTDVVINVLSGNYSVIELYKDGSLYKSERLKGTKDVTFNDLPTGMYEACLAKDTEKSDRTRFEVASTDFTVKFENNSIVLSDLGGRPAWISVNSKLNPDYLSVIETSPGVWTYSGDELANATHVRVHLIGKYSRYTGDSKRFR